MNLLDRLTSWLDKEMAETWPAYAFMAGLVLVGCCCLGGPLGVLIGAAAF